MSQQIQTTSRDAVLVEEAALIRMMGMPVLEAVPSRQAHYALTDPFILVHEARFRLSELAGKETRHPHRGFDNLWYVLQGSASTGHTTGPGGSVERARLSEGSLLWLRTGRGAWHAEAIGADERTEGRGDTEFRSVLFWVNLARNDKQAEPPALVVDVELPDGGQLTTPVPREFQGFAYLLDGEAVFGGNKRLARPPQLVLLGPGEELTVADATPGTRFLLMAGKPYREAPVFNGPFVD
jgi:redox-sensitive bicupin YhaK (pirin superfamily)